MCPKNVYSSFPLILKYADCIDQLQGRYPDLCFQMKADAQRSTIFDVLDDPVLSEMSIMHAISMVFRYCYQIVSKKSPEYTRHTVIAVPSGLSPASIRIVKDAAHLAGFDDVTVTGTSLSQAYK